MLRQTLLSLNSNWAQADQYNSIYTQRYRVEKESIVPPMMLLVWLSPIKY